MAAQWAAGAHGAPHQEVPEAPALPTAAAQREGFDGNVFRRDEKGWVFAFRGQERRLRKHLYGLPMLAHLLGRPHEPVPALVLQFPFARFLRAGPFGGKRDVGGMLVSP
jgi:hypothetical protein